MKIISHSRGLLGLAALLSALFLPHTAAALTGTEILHRVDANLRPPTFETYRKLINIEPDGKRKEFVLFSVKKGTDKVLALFLSPASEKGRSTLRLGENMWLYIPNVGKPLRITSLQSVVGGVFNNADILSLDYSVEYNVVALREDGAAYRLTLKAKTQSVAYDRLEMEVDRKLLLPTRIEAYAASGMLIKVLVYKNIKDFGNGVKRPAVLETESPLYKGYKSIILWAGVKPRPLEDEVFTVNFMSRVAELR